MLLMGSKPKGGKTRKGRDKTEEQAKGTENNIFTGTVNANDIKPVTMASKSDWNTVRAKAKRSIFDVLIKVKDDPNLYAFGETFGM